MIGFAVYFFSIAPTQNEKRAYRGEDGKTHYTSAKTYKEWKEEFVKESYENYEESGRSIDEVKKKLGVGKKVELLNVNETTMVSEKKDKNSYSVDRNEVNNKGFHDKFEKLTQHKAVNESIYQEVMKMLEHRDGTGYEDLVALDARTGKIIAINNVSNRIGGVGFNKRDYDVVVGNENGIILIHNHPNSSRPSFADIRALFKENNIEKSVIIGHNGDVHIIFSPNRKFDIDKYYEEMYNKYMVKYENKSLAEHKALDEIYSLDVFRYDRS